MADLAVLRGMHFEAAEAAGAHGEFEALAAWCERAPSRLVRGITAEGAQETVADLQSAGVQVPHELTRAICAAQDYLADLCSGDQLADAMEEAWRLGFTGDEPLDALVEIAAGCGTPFESAGVLYLLEGTVGLHSLGVAQERARWFRDRLVDRLMQLQSESDA